MRISQILFALTLGCYTLDLGLFVFRVLLSKQGIRSQRGVLYVAFALHTLALAASALESKQCPLFSLPDSLCFLAWIIILICLLLGRRYRLNALEGFAPVLVIILMGASALVGHRVALPMHLPAKAWILVHAGLYFLGYAAFAITFLSGLVYLLLENQLKKRHLTVFTGDLGSLALADRINHAALRVGVLCLTIGIATGIWIMKELRGAWISSLWTDPKIAIALFTWVLYMALLFVRSTNRLRGRKIAYLSMAGFALVFATFFSIHHLDRVF